MNKEIYNNIKETFLEEARLIGRLDHFFNEFIDFEFDEMGINYEEVDEIAKKAQKINDKLIKNINEKTSLNITTKRVDIENRKVEYRVEFEEEESDFAILIENDGFTIETDELSDEDQL